MNVRTIIALVVTAVWAAGYTAAIVTDGHFQPDLGVNAVMLLVAGYFFATGIKKGPRE
jgi:hypothetical protein